MAKKRNKLEVIRDILLALKRNHRLRITPLIYKSNLSNNVIKVHIENLIKNGLIEEINNSETKYYQITRKGDQFLEDFNKIRIFLSFKRCENIMAGIID